MKPKNKVYCYGAILDKNGVHKLIYGWKIATSVENAIGMATINAMNNWPGWCIATINSTEIPTEILHDDN